MDLFFPVDWPGPVSPGIYNSETSVDFLTVGGSLTFGPFQGSLL